MKIIQIIHSPETVSSLIGLGDNGIVYELSSNIINGLHTWRPLCISLEESIKLFGELNA